MGDIIKALIDGLDKLSDILNIGRLVFYTAAGFCTALPVSMGILLMGQDQVRHGYWVQFMSDLVRSCRSYPVWIAGMVFGFVISALSNATVRLDDVTDDKIDKVSFSFLYPKMFSGGVRLKDTNSKDYAAWLISEYYRYFEIALFIPYGLMLSLPLYSAYSLGFVLRTSLHAKGFVLGAGFFAFPLWVFLSVLVWAVIWPDYWVPNVVQTIFVTWTGAKRNASAGLDEFIAQTRPPDSPPAPGANAGK